MDRRRITFVVTAAFALAFDQLTKIWARHALLPIYPRVKTVIPKVWEMRYSENPGAAFGLLRDIPAAQYLFIVIAIAIAIGAFFYLKRASLTRPLRVAVELGLIVGGALGNAIDRVRFGAVTDFIDVSRLHFPWVFNVADAAINVGIACLLLDMLMQDRQDKAARATGDAA